MNVLDPIERIAQARAQLPALLAGGKTFTFGQLWDMTGAVAWRLQRQGVQQGTGVALAGLANDTHLIANLALCRLGAVSMNLPGRMLAAELGDLLRLAGVTHVVHGADSQPDAPGHKLIAEDSLTQPLPAFELAPATVRGLADERSQVALSSGTTGVPKAIPMTHRERAVLLRNAGFVYPGGPGERLLLWAGSSIGFWVGHAFTQLCSGGAVVVRQDATPQHCEQLIRETRPTRMSTTTGAAFSLAEHFKARGLDAGQLGLVSLVLSGGVAPPALLAILQKHVCPNIYVSYGSTEFGTAARSDEASRLARPQAAGRLMPWVQAQAVDAQGEPLPPGETGHLRFRSHQEPVRGCYLGDEEASGKAFRDGWFYPGDVGDVDAQGYLTLGGREDDRLNLDGQKVDPAHVERELAAEPGVLEVAAVPVLLEHGRQVLVAAIVADGQPDLPALKRRLTQLAGGICAVVKVDALPRNEGGKVLRGRLARVLQESLGKNLVVKKPQ